MRLGDRTVSHGRLHLQTRKREDADDAVMADGACPIHGPGRLVKMSSSWRTICCGRTVERESSVAYEAGLVVESLPPTTLPKPLPRAPIREQPSGLTPKSLRTKLKKRQRPVKRDRFRDPLVAKLSREVAEILREPNCHVDVVKAAVLLIYAVSRELSDCSLLSARTGYPLQFVLEVMGRYKKGGIWDGEVLAHAGWANRGRWDLEAVVGLALDAMQGLGQVIMVPDA